MPYKPTGRPPGRPRKHPVMAPADFAAFEKQSAVEWKKELAKPSKPKLTRARRAFRAQAERLAPSPAVRLLGKRPRHKPSSQTRFA